jgi:hypothetical protein
MAFRIIYLFTLLSVAISLANAQTTYPKGGYLSLQDWLNKQPKIAEQDYELVSYKPLKKSDIVSYKVKPKNENFKIKFFRKKVFAVTDNDTLYINSKILGISPQFSKVFLTGKHIVFLVTIKDDEIQKAASIFFGLIGALVTSETVKMKTYFFSLNTVNEYAQVLTPETLTKLLTPFPDLLESYNIDERYHKDWDKVMLYYMNRLNEKFAK